jgi:DNA polymerase elongation subunit (family B)
MDNTSNINMEKSDKLEFQIYDWNTYHEIDSNDEERYVIQLFGRTDDDKDVCLKVTGFTPFFYIKIPDNWGKRQIDKFVEILKNKVSWCVKDNPRYNYDLSKSLVKYCCIRKHDFYYFTNKKLFRYIMLVFKSYIAMKYFSYILESPIKIPGLGNKPILFQRYESNIEPHIRFMHINNLSSCGWVSLDRSNLKEIRNYSRCDYSYEVNWKYVRPSNNDERMAPFKIMGYDIECISCDNNFPQAERKTDKIIQIGITMYRYDSMNCYEQHILTLGECASIKGANVQSYQTEKDLLRGFAQKISDLRPDFKAGYNNFGFDDKYIIDRISRIDKEEADNKEINVNDLDNKFMDEFMQIIGKINNKYLMEFEGLKKSLSYFETKNLSSSALGDNDLKFIQVPGIISIDMMKVIQREHSLAGYKLDNVTANFITEGIIKVLENEKDDTNTNISIYTKNTKALDKGSYIQIMINDGYSSYPLNEGAKYRVLDICTISAKNNMEESEENTTIQCIQTRMSNDDVNRLKEATSNKLFKTYWTFAKDDMHHTQINQYYREGNPKKIRQIAKYCLKDCKLVNLLLAKLEIIVNKIAMAKVCHVPLSYLFLRGQGVKIFSLISKKCREKNFLIPVLVKKEINDDNEETYEGAAVITPIPSVYLSPISVLDFSSLYPNSMREKNLSHECYVNNPEYDNLPGYIYHDIYITLKDKKGRIIRNIDGTPQKKLNRFAQEIVTEEQINIELKDVINQIYQEMNSNIFRIMEQTEYTSEIRNKMITVKKAQLEKIKNRIKDNNIPYNEMKQLVNDQKNIEIMIDLLQNQENRIREIIDLHNEYAKSIIEDNKINYERKNYLIAKKKRRCDNTIRCINSELELSEVDKKDLIQFEEESAQRRIMEEKYKRYNVINGQMVRYGIIPEILSELLNKRKETNIRLSKEKDSFLRNILNALQLAFKITANSLYGQTGAVTSPIYLLAIAESTTAIGRERLYHAKKTVEENFPGSEIIYGDSITGDTPLTLRDENGNIIITTIEKLGKIWLPYENFHAWDVGRKEKQQSYANYEVMTAHGWSKIVRVIRHKTQKKIYRIRTHNGCIDVTEDHSLLDANGTTMKPVDCSIGMKMMHRKIDPNNQIMYDPISVSCWGRDRKHLDLIINGDIISKKIYLEAYFPAVKKMDQFIVIDFDSKLEAQIMYYLFQSAGYYIIINNAIKTYQLMIMQPNMVKRNNDTAIMTIEYIRTTSDTEYVYDLETESGTFHAGIGEIVIRNTDSIFINFHIKDEKGNDRTDKESLVRSIELAQKAAKKINNSVPKPHSIVYEKTFHPFILVAKKKYVGLLFEKDPNKYIIKSMGIVLKRRDNAPIVKTIVGGIIHHILENRDIEKAISYTNEIIQNLMDGKYSIDKFVISKTLKAKYKKPSVIAHKVLADRMAIRDPGNKPQINDRIPFVYIVTNIYRKKKKDILQGDLVEHPDYVIKNGIQIDYLYYLEHQIINPVSQILELMIPRRMVEKIFQKYIVAEENKRMGKQNMEKWMDHSKIKTPESKIDITNCCQETHKTLQNTGKRKKQICQDITKWTNNNDPNTEWEPSFD